MRRLATVLVFSSLCIPLYAGNNWPEFRGPLTNGHSDAQGLPLNWSESENVKWKTHIHGRAWSSPVVWGNQIWMTTATEDGKKMYAVCVARDSGKIIHDILLFENEKPRFCHKFNSYASPTPAIEGGRVYIHFGSYGTVCLDTADGKTIWTRRDLPCNHFRGPGSSPILFENMLIVHFDGFDFQYVVALDKEDGKDVWKTDRDIDYGTTNGDFMKAYSTPIVIDVNGKKQLISPAAKATVAYDPHSGKELWKIYYKQHSISTRPLWGHGLLFISTGFGKAEMFAMRPDGKGDVTETNVAWKQTKGIGSKPSPLLIGDHLFVIHDTGTASCLHAQTGQQVWQHRIGGNYSASPVFADGRIYFFSQDGKSTVIAPKKEYEELAVNQLDDGFMASPAVSGKSLILRTRTHLYRIEETNQK